VTAPPVPIRCGNTGILCLMDTRFLVEILGVERNQIWVTFPGVCYPLAGMGGRLEFHHDTGFIAYNVQVLHYAEHPASGIILERSESADQRTHRTSWRVPTNIEVVFRTPHSPEHFTAVMEDLSAEGAQLRAHAVLPVRTVLELGVALDREHGQQVIEARICYAHEEAGPRNPGALRYGVRFTNMPPATRRLLTLFLYHHVRKLYPRDVAAMYPRTRRPVTE
jgi:hypothetical protein